MGAIARGSLRVLGRRARAAKASAFAAIREQDPLPPLAGTVDILPSEQTSVLANRLDYHPRPSFQDYSTYTAGLIDANRDFYAGGAAPDWVLFGPGGLDDRYPTLTEGCALGLSCSGGTSPSAGPVPSWPCIAGRRH